MTTLIILAVICYLAIGYFTAWRAAYLDSETDLVSMLFIAWPIYWLLFLLALIYYPIKVQANRGRKRDDEEASRRRERWRKENHEW
jgi:ABC-type dipeptide/oligopeptide/nickel transport system permease component